MDELDLLVAAARTGGGWAFGRLWEQLAPSVAAYLRGRGVRDADDVTSEVFLAAFRGIGRFHGDGVAFRSWLFTIAHHKSVDVHRRPATREVLVDAVAAAGDCDACSANPSDPKPARRRVLTRAFAQAAAAAAIALVAVAVATGGPSRDVVVRPTDSSTTVAPPALRRRTMPTRLLDGTTRSRRAPGPDRTGRGSTPLRPPRRVSPRRCRTSAAPSADEESARETDHAAQPGGVRRRPRGRDGARHRRRWRQVRRRRRRQRRDPGRRRRLIRSLEHLFDHVPRWAGGGRHGRQAGQPVHARAGRAVGAAQRRARRLSRPGTAGWPSPPTGPPRSDPDCWWSGGRRRAAGGRAGWSTWPASGPVCGRWSRSGSTTSC